MFELIYAAVSIVMFVVSIAVVIRFFSYTSAMAEIARRNGSNNTKLLKAIYELLASRE